MGYSDTRPMCAESYANLAYIDFFAEASAKVAMSDNPDKKTKPRPLPAQVEPPGERALKRDRLHLRLDTNSRHLIEQAAYYLNKTASEFVVSQSVLAAEQVVESYGRTMSLSEADWEQFCDALENPPEPNEKLKAAALLYAKRGGPLAK